MAAISQARSFLDQAQTLNLQVLEVEQLAGGGLIRLQVKCRPHTRQGSGIDIYHETVRSWWHRFGLLSASEIRKRRVEGMRSSSWRWQLDEVFVKINGERHYLWRPVDHEGEVVENFVTNTGDKKAALKVPPRRTGRPRQLRGAPPWSRPGQHVWEDGQTHLIEGPHPDPLYFPADPQAAPFGQNLDGGHGRIGHRTV